MSAEAVLTAPQANTGSVRRNLILLAIASLPFTYAFTIDLRFPLKIYEVALALVLLTYLRELRIPFAPGAMVPVRRIAVFVVAVGILGLLRLVAPAEGSSAADFGARFGPAGDAVAKFAYLSLAILGFLLFTRRAYADHALYLRAWRIGAITAATYSWYLALAGLLGFQPLLLPGIEDPKYFEVAGRAIIRSGTFVEGNILGLFLLVSAGLALYERRRLAAIFLSLTIFLSFSTVNVLALPILWGVYWFQERSEMSLQRRVLYLVSGILVALLLGVVLVQLGYVQSVVVAKLSSDDPGSLVKRIAFVLAGLRMFADHPWLGVGLSQFGYFYNNYQPLGILGTAQTVKLIPNNIYVELLSELGLLGFLLFGAFLVSIYRRLRPPALAPLRATFIAILFALNAFPTYTVMFLWAFFGLTVGASAGPAQASSAPGRT
jgi:O-antigen ligase